MIYFKANARGYAVHEDLLKIEGKFDKKKLKFFSSLFGLHDSQSFIVKKALYNPNSINEKVLYDFQMLGGAREKPDFDFTGLQKVEIIQNKISTNGLK